MIAGKEGKSREGLVLQRRCEQLWPCAWPNGNLAAAERLSGLQSFQFSDVITAACLNVRRLRRRARSAGLSLTAWSLIHHYFSSARKIHRILQLPPLYVGFCDSNLLPHFLPCKVSKTNTEVTFAVVNARSNKRGLEEVQCSLFFCMRPKSVLLR